MSTESKPNVLIVMSDQHHHRFMGCAGHELLQTPVMDRMASNGRRFGALAFLLVVLTPAEPSTHRS